MPYTLQDQREIDGRRAWADALGDRLEKTGVTKQELSRQLGISRAQLDKYAAGEVTPPGKHLSGFHAVIGFEFWQQLSLLGWLTAQDAAQARRLQTETRRHSIYRELQGLLQLDQEVHDVTPAARLASVLLNDGWTVKQYVVERGNRAPVAFADVLELVPPAALAQILQDKTQPAEPLEPLSKVQKHARLGLTQGEQELRKVVEDVLGADRWNQHEVYWAERGRFLDTESAPSFGPSHTTRPDHHPGLVMTVPRWLRRRYPDDQAVPLSRTGRGGLTSVAFLGLPYSGTPDLAARTADLLHWGFVGVAMLARQERYLIPNLDPEQLQAFIAQSLARGDDPRSQYCTWTYNEPIAITDSAELLRDGKTAVVHARLTDQAIDQFLVPIWGNNKNRSEKQILQWRTSCDNAAEAYRRQHGEEDWLTVDVDLGQEHVGDENESARQDYYELLYSQVSSWLNQRYGISEVELNAKELKLLELLAQHRTGYTDSTLARVLDITVAAAKVEIENLRLKLRLDSRASLYTYALHTTNNLASLLPGSAATGTR